MADKNSSTADTLGKTLYYDELHFVRKKDKTTEWAAQVLYFNKMVSVSFIDHKEVKFYRDLENGIIDKNLYKQFIDPVTPDGKGGEAAYFKANWQTCPIYMHLENIKEAQLKKLPINIVCKAADEFSKLKQQKDNDKIIGAKYMRSFLNEINPQFGIRPLKEDEDPFEFIASMEQMANQPTAPGSPNPASVISSIRNKITNNEQMAIWNQYLYKDGVEAAIEIGISEYLNSINKFKQGILPRLIEDIKNFNACLVRHYTSETTGRPVIEYQDPADKIQIADCKKQDLSDNTIFIKEWEISFGQFVQMAGADLEPEVLKEVFLKNRDFHGVTGDYEHLTTFQRNSARIRIGYHEFETQDMEVYAEFISKAGNKVFKKEDDDYTPAKPPKGRPAAKRIEKHYNVWYSHYYIPLDSLYTSSGTTSFREQSKYIFKFGPIQDQVREGDDFRYAKGTVLGWKSKRFSFAKIEHSYMPEIIKLWQLFQNDLSSSMSDGVIWNEEVVNSMMKYIDMPNATPAQKKMAALKFLRQTNSAIASFTKMDGEEAQDQKLFEKVTLNSLDLAAQRLVIIAQLYDLLIRSLGLNEIAEGQSPQPRQNFGGINLAMIASNNASYPMEEGVIAVTLTLGERLMYYIKEVVDEGDSARFKEFYDMVGAANAMAAASIKDIPLHRLNLHLENQMTDQQKQAIMQTANEMAKAGVISPDQVLFLSMIDNVKYAYAILAIEIRAGQLAIAEANKAAKEEARENQLFQSKLKIQENHASKADEAHIKQMVAEIDGKLIVMENQMKQHGQEVIKNMINEHRTQQAIIENRLGQKNMLQEAVLDKAVETND